METRNPGPVKETNIGTASILVVLGTSIDPRMVTGALRRFGDRIIVTSDCAEAEDLAVRLAPDIFLVNSELPDDGGGEFFRFLKRHPDTCETPVIFLAGNPDLTRKAEIFAAGAADLIVGPFDPGEILAKVGLQLRLRAAEAGLAQLERELGESRTGIESIRAAHRAELDTRNELLRLKNFALDHVREAMFLIDQEARFVFVNEEACRSLGYEHGELLGMTVIDIDPRFTREIWNSAWEELCAKGSNRFESVHRRKDGSTFPVEIHANQFEFNGSAYDLALVHDITGRKRAEELLAAKEREFRSLVENFPDNIARYAADGRARYFNPALESFLGVTAEEAAMLRREPADSGRDYMEYIENVRAVGRTGTSREFELRIQKAPGDMRHHLIRIVPERGQAGEIIGVLAIGRDITETRRAELERTLLNRAVNASSDAAFLIGESGRFVYVNDTACRSLGYSRDELLAMAPSDIDPEATPEVMSALFSDGFASDPSRSILGSRHRARDGRTFPVEINASLIDHDGARFCLAFARDITDRKAMETALRIREREFRTLAENLPDNIVRYDLAGRTVYVNPNLEKTLGDTAAAMMGTTIREFRPEFEEFACLVDSVLASGLPGELELRVPTPPGEAAVYHLIRVVPERDENGLMNGVLAIGRDISRHKRAEEELLCGEARLRRVNRALSTLSAGNEALVRATDEQDFLEHMCRVVVETGGHTLAWIGFLAPDGRTIEERARAGLEGVCFSRGNGDCGAIAAAVRNCRPVVGHDIAADADYAGCHELILASGCRSALTLPLMGEEDVLGVLAIQTTDPSAFDEDEVVLFAELADDLAYGIRALRTRIGREESLRHVQATMVATIQALASTVELRDPYTAGHQRRVADLAAAIGREMGLSLDRIQGLSLAAIVHDVGKIYVPSEILSKPGRLSGIEFDLVKMHVDAGYDILKSIDFPWPIADVVRQHHERQDGSGYPAGAKGDGILLEARILAVADVVEAITTHRPYRAALGMESALGEITSGRGTRFDAGVVDACMRLFREGGFDFA